MAGDRLPWLALWLPIGLIDLAGLFVGYSPFAYGGRYAFPLALVVHFWGLRRWDGESWQRLYHAVGLPFGLIGTTEISMRVVYFVNAIELTEEATYRAALWPLWFAADGRCQLGRAAHHLACGASFSALHCADFERCSRSFWLGW